MRPGADPGPQLGDLTARGVEEFTHLERKLNQLAAERDFSVHPAFEWQAQSHPAMPRERQEGGLELKRQRLEKSQLLSPLEESPIAFLGTPGIEG